jgi:trehalose 6-phosphate synthase/phosphatase
MGRLLLVSNRLPVTASLAGNRFAIEQSAGGLATGLRGAQWPGGCRWIGWPGDLPRLSSAKRAELQQELSALDCVPVWLSKREVRGFYDDTSNAVLWPVFHYFIDSIPPDAGAWDAYRAVNQKFAQRVAEEYRTGDEIWVHDYQLLLLPGMLRELIPAARIGFFLHIPFPSADVFSVLPWREEILRGMLGADVIGFHTPEYLRHFTNTLVRVLGLDAQVDHVVEDGRDVQLGVYPMGIDAATWSARAERPDILANAAEIRSESGGRKLLVGIDRLDYTKGILRRLLGFERLLKQTPELRERVRLLQVSVPSRERVGSYSDFRRKVDELVGKINGELATPNWTPIVNMHRSLSPDEVAALYRAADVMLVTPLRDGMNLVAKEFVASRSDEDGVLVLSEFAGAAWELGEALHANPYDVDHLASRIRKALEMSDDERRSRMRSLRRRVMSYDVHRWVAAFTDDLRARAPAFEHRVEPPLADPIAIGARYAAMRRFALILDYDGTAVPFADTPWGAAPDPELIDLLRAIGSDPAVDVHVISGRSRLSLDRWLGGLPLSLHAEHGLWSRPRGGEWTLLRDAHTDWKAKVRRILEQFTAATDGTFIEEKTASMAWHYRNAVGDHGGDEDFGEHQAKELRMLLGDLLQNQGLEVLHGAKVVEVRMQGVHKGRIVPEVVRDERDDTPVLAIGDDRTDEDMFEALPRHATSVHVGDGPSRAVWRVESVEDVRQILRALRDRRLMRSAGLAATAV